LKLLYMPFYAAFVFVAPMRGDELDKSSYLMNLLDK